MHGVVQETVHAGADDQLWCFGLHVHGAQEAGFVVDAHHRVVYPGGGGDAAQVDVGGLLVLIEGERHPGGQAARAHGDGAARLHARGQMVERLPNLQGRGIRVRHVRERGGTDDQQQEQDQRR